ncbi:hypothetical protein CLV86_1874 [Lacinutrix venerupis]|uniref:hypothetical protein n=1 Tax=Lacinutrix venerupis TaxID=1486034 RepID=UPI000EB57AC3|nr:hypothetical protein [Lacinutrix venerupis]RLJ63337.1 hypothetical protein CLV86_1874 [Lacinutrix venerupis]
MKRIQLSLLVALILCFVTKSFSQHRNIDIKNGFGLFGGITQFDIITDNFETTKGNGWVAGMSATVEIPHKWYNASYGMQLSENNFGIAGVSNLDFTTQELEYKVFTAQVLFLWHAKLAGSYLTFDFGPMLQYNSDLELKNEQQEQFLVTNYTALTAKEIEDISNFNANGVVGLTAGFSIIKFKAQYIYGFLNTLNALNSNNNIDMEDNNKFKGNQSMFAFSAMITF